MPYIIVDHTAATKKLIDDAHEQGIEVFAYTVNKKNIAQKLKQLTIDGIITDYPDILR